jgi:hypothetical protein
LIPFIRVTRWHPNVGHHDVRGRTIDDREQGVEVAAGRGDFEAVLRVEEPPDALADEVMVFGEDDTDGHGRRIRP